MTGAEIITTLEDAMANTLDDGGSSGSYPYAYGLRFDVDASDAEVYSTQTYTGTDGCNHSESDSCSSY